MVLNGFPFPISIINTGSGRLKLTIKGLLPLDPTITKCKTKGGCSLVGDVRGDENIALHSMHTLWVREHNRIATELKKLNAKWSGEKLYQETRKIVGAIFQHIVYTEWLPNIAKLPTYHRYNQYFDSSIINAFASAAFRFGHSLIPNAFSQVDMGYNKMREDMLLQKAFFNTDYIHKNGIESTMMGLSANQSSEVFIASCLLNLISSISYDRMRPRLDPQIAYGSTEISDENHGNT